MSSSLKYRPIEERELAKDFGFDVTAPTGGVQTSAVSNREYKTECRKIYSEFLMNMRDYIFQEEQIKHDLIKMREQAATPKKQFRDSCGSVSTRSVASRRNSAHTEFSDGNSSVNNRQGRINLNKKRPKTVIGTQRKVSSDVQSTVQSCDRAFPDIGSAHDNRKRDSSILKDGGNKNPPTSSSIEDHNAIVESSADFSCSRVIKMNPRAYSKLVCGKANVHVLNRSAGYLLKPVSDSKTKTLMPKDVSKHARTNCPERLAIMREKTNFKSPTLSNDLKVNNLIAIKKSLVGDISPRLTVGHVMNSARERRSRVYRIQLTQDEIDSPPPASTPKSPINQGFLRSKTSCSTPASPRLTRKNLAKFEQELQKETIERLRKTVVDMVACVENRGYECSDKFNNSSNIWQGLQDEVLDQYHEDKFLPTVKHDFPKDVVDDNNSNERSKFYDSLRRQSRAFYHETVTKPGSRRLSKFQTSLNNSPRVRIRGDMSMRPSTIKSGFCSENSSPRHISHQDTMAFVRHSKEHDMDRDMEMNRWRQRMIFVVGKKD